MSTQLTHWLITAYDYVYAEIGPQVQKLFQEKKLRNFAYQEETCPTSGRVHLQMYLGFYRNVRQSCINKIIGRKGWHYEKDDPRSPKAMWTYCQKVDTRLTDPCMNLPFNENSPGKRTDVEKACEVARVSGITGLINTMPEMYVKYRAGFEGYVAALTEDSGEIREKEVCFWYGKTGTGKTHDALEGDACRVEKQGLFYDYSGADTAVFDEADGFNWSRAEILKLTDKYPIRVPKKGGWVLFNPSKVIFISNDHPVCWLPCIDDALRRRVSEVRRYTSKGVFVRETL